MTSDAWLRALRGWSPRMWLMAWFVFAVFVGLAVGGVNVATYLRLSSAGVRTQATVVDRQPTNHDRTVVEYNVGGNVYREGRTFVAVPNKRPLAVGDAVVVVYLPSDPAVMTLGDPRELLSNELGSVALAALVLPTLAIGVTYLRVQASKQKSGRAPS